MQNRFILQRASCFTLYVQEFHNDFLLDPATVDPQPGVCGGRQLFIVIGNHIRDLPPLLSKRMALWIRKELSRGFNSYKLSPFE